MFKLTIALFTLALSSTAFAQPTKSLSANEYGCPSIASVEKKINLSKFNASILTSRSLGCSDVCEQQNNVLMLSVYHPKTSQKEEYVACFELDGFNEMLSISELKASNSDSHNLELIFTRENFKTNNYNEKVRLVVTRISSPNSTPELFSYTEEILAE